jgi:Zinc finger, C2H2 type.
MRNVPERPYKCNYCPSSTFSTQSNLKKHVQTKHSPVGPGPAPQSLIPRCVIEGKILVGTVKSFTFERSEVLAVVLLKLQVFQGVALFHFMRCF